MFKWKYVSLGQREVLIEALIALAPAWAGIREEHSEDCLTRRYAEVILDLAGFSWTELQAWATFGDGSYEL